jgi:hypothetical protein
MADEPVLAEAVAFGNAHRALRGLVCPLHRVSWTARRIVDASDAAGRAPHERIDLDGPRGEITELGRATHSRRPNIQFRQSGPHVHQHRMREPTRPHPAPS